MWVDIMMYIYILLLMIFLHIINDYNLQGWLASAKQKEWWTINAPRDMYKHDYIVALFEHAFSWAFMVQLPIAALDYLAFNNNNMLYSIIACILNMFVHAYIDNEKANRRTINLVQDQIMHFAQIILTLVLFLLWIRVS